MSRPSYTSCSPTSSPSPRQSAHCPGRSSCVHRSSWSAVMAALLRLWSNTFSSSHPPPYTATNTSTMMRLAAPSTSVGCAIALPPRQLFLRVGDADPHDAQPRDELHLLT